MSRVRIRVNTSSPTLSPSKTSQLLNDSDFQTGEQVAAALDGKVDKVAGKGLSANDYTDEEKAKLGGIEAQAEVNNVFVAVYGTTTYNEIVAAQQAGKTVLCKDGNFVANLTRMTPAYITFSVAYYNSDDINHQTKLITKTCTNTSVWSEAAKYLEHEANKTTVIDAESTDIQYPSAKAVYAALVAEAEEWEAADAELEKKIEAALIEETASGNPAAFDDGADGIPVKSLTAEIAYKTSGSTSCTVSRSGKNLLDDTKRVFAGGNIFFGGATSQTGGLSAFLPSGDYTISVETAGGTATNLYVKDKLKNEFVSGFPAYDKKSQSFTLDTATEIIVFVYNPEYTSTSDILTAQIEVGDFATSYAPYTGQEYTVDWSDVAGTVYGGALNVTTGVLTSTLDENGDPLPAPTTYQLTPTEVRTLLGDNTIFSDTGDVTVTYLVDTATEMDGKVSKMDYKPVTATESMTRPVGKDANGRLWTTPQSGGAVDDVQIDGISIVQAGVANVLVSANYGLSIIPTSRQIYVATSNTENIKSGQGGFRPISPLHQHESTFYGLAKAAGSDEKNSTLPVGQYTEAAKSAISEMLNGAVTVEGTTPTINALFGVRYVCGEVATLDITLPASGIVDVTFESGATATVLTITPPTGVTLKWANDFDPTSLEANTTYEINIMDGIGVAVGVSA